MTAQSRLVVSLVIVALSLSTIVLLARARHSVLCVTADFSGSSGAEALVKSGDFAWIREAKACDFGQFVVVTSPRDPRAAMVFRKGPPTHALFAIAGQSSSLFDGGGRQGLRGLVVQHTSDQTVVFNPDGYGNNLLVTPDAISLQDAGSRTLLKFARPKAGRNFLSYSVHDVSQDAWIENTDVGIDGSFDIRTTEVRGRPTKTEIRVGGRWLERVDRNGQPGTMLDAHWMSFAEARAKLRSKEK